MKINEGTLGNITEQRKPQLYRCGRLKFRKPFFFKCLLLKAVEHGSPIPADMEEIRDGKYT
jgi:hypothetical protein